MKSLIEEAYFSYLEKEKIEFSTEYYNSSAEVEKIIKALDGEHKEIFEKIWHLQFEMIAESEFYHFKSGFRYGMKLAMEVAPL